MEIKFFSTPLEKVGEIELLGERFDLARDGKFYLCRATTDAYGKSCAKIEGVDELLDKHEPFSLVQALLDALGEVVVSLRHERDVRLGTRGEP